MVSIPIGQNLAAKKMLHTLEMRGITSVELRHEQFSLATNSNKKMISNIPSSLSSSTTNSSILSNSNHNDNDHNNSIINDDSKQTFVDEELEPLRIFQNYMSTVYKQDINLKNSIFQVLNDDRSSSNSSNDVDSMPIITNESIHKAVMKEGIELIEKLSNYINIHPTTTSIKSASNINKNKSGGKSSKASSISSATASKLTAEVCLTGMINNKSFKLIRRRSSKKSELYFYVDDIDYTTQSVKDTQIIVDDILGTGKGLVERCCFFGQHSHTLHVR